MSTYTLSFGPFASSLRHPQRLVCQVDCDTIVDVHYRTGYNHRGCAERMPKLALDQALYLASRVCGACSHAHTLAFCQAIETLMEQDIPARAAYLRSLVAELERLASHLRALTAIFDVLGMHQYTATLRELSLSARQCMMLVSGTRIMPDMCLPGGTRRNLADQQRNETLVLLAKMNRRIAHVIEQVTDNAALSARTVDIGTVVSPAAKQFGLRGPIARASGINDDIRLNQPYAAYSTLAVSNIAVEEGGDVYARLVVLLLEAFESVKLGEQILHDLPGGQWEGSVPKELPSGHASSFVEGPHGMLRYTIESDNRRLTSVTIDPPHQLDRLLVRAILVGADLDNALLIVLSTDPCLACAEC